MQPPRRSPSQPASRAEAAAVNAAGLVQGIALVTFPAASTIFTARSAAFGVGPLAGAGLRLPEIFGVSAAVAAAMGLLSLAVAHGRPSPRTMHPAPSPVADRRPVSGRAG
jgi:hypothetical protein